MISRDRLFKGAEQLGLTLDKDTLERLVVFSNLVLKWNKTHNLTSIENEDDFVDKHILDSLTLLPKLLLAIESHRCSSGSAKNSLSLLDIGSGAGFPGIVLAIACNRFLLTSVDSSQKRIAFQNHVLRELNLTKVETAYSRIEDMENQKFNIITCRAFASIEKIVEKSRHLIERDGKWFLMKGAFPSEEIAMFNQQELSQDFKIKNSEAIAIPGLEAERHLVTVQAA